MNLTKGGWRITRVDGFGMSSRSRPKLKVVETVEREFGTYTLEVCWFWWSSAATPHSNAEVYLDREKREKIGTLQLQPDNKTYTVISTPSSRGRPVAPGAAGIDNLKAAFDWAVEQSEKYLEAGFEEAFGPLKEKEADVNSW